MDERVWLRHPDTGGAFHCPVAALNAWMALGWERGEAPVEVNPAIAERVAFEQARQAAQAATDDEPAVEPVDSIDLQEIHRD